VSSKKRSRIWLPGKIVIGVVGVVFLCNFAAGSHPSWYYMAGVLVQALVLMLTMLAIAVLEIGHQFQRTNGELGKDPFHDEE
jgi:protein-S-isoprenylcysteine O-methyltransferase Ste14